MVGKDFDYCPSCIELIKKQVCVHMPLKDSQDEGWLNGIKKVLTNVPCPQHGWWPGSAKSGTFEVFPKADEEGEDQEGK